MNVDFSARLAHYSNFLRFLGTTFLCLVKDTKMDRQYILHHIANEGPLRIQYKCLVPIYVFPEMKLLFPKQSYNFLFPKQSYNFLSPSSYTYVDRSWEYINRSQTHECGNWDWGRAITRKGIHKWDFPCNAGQNRRVFSAKSYICNSNKNVERQYGSLKKHWKATGYTVA